MIELFTEAELLSGLLCKAFSRHMFDGNIWQEKDKYNKKIWREEFECQWCLTTRATPLEPKTAIVVGSRKYYYTEAYNKSLEHEQAYRTVIQRLFKKGTSLP